MLSDVPKWLVSLAVTLVLFASLGFVCLTVGIIISKGGGPLLLGLAFFLAVWWLVHMMTTD